MQWTLDLKQERLKTQELFISYRYSNKIVIKPVKMLVHKNLKNTMSFDFTWI